MDLMSLQARIEIARRNINNLRYADVYHSKGKEKLNSLLMKVKKESEKADLKLNIKKIRSWHPVPSWQIEEEKEAVTDFLSLKSLDGNCRHKIKTLAPWEAAAAAAKSLQSCLTLCDPTDSSPPGSTIPGILQARALEWVAIAFYNA